MFRRKFGGSHEDYLNEPAANVAWFMALEGLERPKE
jgi:hypothetical protein